MRELGTLFVGVLSVIAVLTITAVLMAISPYIAGGIVIIGLCWLYSGKDSPDDKSPVVKSKPD